MARFQRCTKCFFDATKQLNGLNENSSNYSNVYDYQLRVFIDAIVSKDNINTDYRVSSEDITVFDYHEDETGLDTYICDIGTYNELDIPLENNIINNDFTKVIANFTPLLDPTFSQSVDFTDVATVYNATTAPNGWRRFAYGSVTTDRRSGNWTNQTANETDIFNDSVFGSFNRNTVPYTSTQSSIVAD